MVGAQQSGRRRSRAHGRKTRNATINVTPFVDVMLVMLIVFMITAPLLQVGVELKMPETDAKQLPSEVDPLTVSVQRDGTIYLQETQVDRETLLARLAAISKEGYDRPIYVRGDTEAGYGVVLEVVALMNAAGHTKINLVSDANAAARRAAGRPPTRAPVPAKGE